MVSQKPDYCSRKVTHFLKYPTVTVKIIPIIKKSALFVVKIRHLIIH